MEHHLDTIESTVLANTSIQHCQWIAEHYWHNFFSILHAIDISNARLIVILDYKSKQISGGNFYDQVGDELAGKE